MVNGVVLRSHQNSHFLAILPLHVKETISLIVKKMHLKNVFPQVRHIKE